MCDDKIIYRCGDTIVFDILATEGVVLSDIARVRLVNANGWYIDCSSHTESADRYTYTVTDTESRSMPLGKYDIEVKYGTDKVSVIRAYAFELKRSTYRADFSTFKSKN